MRQATEFNQMQDSIVQVTKLQVIVTFLGAHIQQMARGGGGGGWSRFYFGETKLGTIAKIFSRVKNGTHAETRHRTARHFLHLYIFIS